MQFSGRGLTGVLDFAEGFFSVFLLTYPVFKLGMLGAGDGKLFAVCAGAMGVNRGVAFLFCTFLVAAVLAVLKMLYHRNFLQRFRYFFTYAGQAVCTSRLTVYEQDTAERKESRIHLAGPALLALLLYLGGVY